VASTPPSTEVFMREVDEELRREQMTSFWVRWGRWVLVALIVALAAFGAWLWWNHEQTKKAEAEGETLSQIFTDLGEGRSQGVEAKLKPFTESKVDAYRAAAKLTIASLNVTANKTKEAVAGYKSVAEDESLPKPYRDAALIRWTAAEYDTLKPADVVARLKPLAVKGNPWFGSAGEMVAVAYLNQNRNDLAGALFGELAKDEGVPETIRQRAVQMAGLLGVDAVAQPDGEKK
jgi:hypothetical protein